MPNVKINEIQIEYDTLGDPTSPALLLIMGLGAQLIHWDDTFCRALAAKGHYVIRYDNRDVGLSTKLDQAGLPDISAVMNALFRGQTVKPVYTLNDMADDAAGLLAALHIDKAHVCGASMGGMIAQSLAIRQPQRLLSLVSIFSSTGNPQMPPPQPAAMEVLMKAPPTERQAYIDYNVKAAQVIAGSGFAYDEDFLRRLASRSYDRCFYPPGVGRQMLAILTQESRKPALASVTAPTLVIHGTDDPLVPVECGRDTAAAIPGAQLLLIKGMGHDLPHPGQPWMQIAEAIAAHTHKQ